MEENWACRCAVGSQIVFRCFVSSSGGSEPRSARTGAVETQFYIFEPASKNTQFSNNCLGIFENMSNSYKDIERISKTCRIVINTYSKIRRCVPPSLAGCLVSSFRYCFHENGGAASGRALDIFITFRYMFENAPKVVLGSL